MYEIQLSEQDLQNLLVFMSRVELTGKEAPSFCDILHALQNKRPVENNKE